MKQVSAFRKESFSTNKGIVFVSVFNVIIDYLFTYFDRADIDRKIIGLEVVAIIIIELNADE